MYLVVVFTLSLFAGGEGECEGPGGARSPGGPQGEDRELDVETVQGALQDFQQDLRDTQRDRVRLLLLRMVTVDNQ